MKIQIFGNQTIRRFSNQFVAASAATLGSFGCGAIMAWSSPAIPRISQDECGDDCDMTSITKDLASWIGPLVPLGAALAGPVAGFLVNKIGRRKTMLGLTLPFFLGCVLMAISSVIDSIGILYTGRIITGFSSGAFALVAPLYTSETSDKCIRGATSSMTQLMATLGVGFVAALNINGAVHWVSITAICALIPVIMMFWLYLMPESPAFLVTQGKLKEAEDSLRWLRGSQKDVSSELKSLELAKKNQDSIGSISFVTLLSDGRYLKPFVIALFLMFLQQFCGVNVIIFYTQTIFQQAGSSLDPGFCAFLVALFQIFGTGLALVVVDMFGRKILLVLSALTMCLTMTSLGAFFYLDERKENFCEYVNVNCTLTEGFSTEMIQNLSWLPLVSLIVYIFFFSLGVGPLAWTMNIELFSAESKALGTSIAFSFNWTCAFLVTKFEPIVEVYLGASGVYFIFASICAIGSVVVLTCVPETKGKSSEEIQKLFSKTDLKILDSSSTGSSEMSEDLESV